MHDLFKIVRNSVSNVQIGFISSVLLVENYDSNSLLCKTYNMMYQEVIQGRTNVSYNWATQIKHILDESGFNYVWNNQFDVLQTF